MKFNKFGVVFATLAVSMVGIGTSNSSAQAATFFGEDIQQFKDPGELSKQERKELDAPDLGVLTNSYNAEQDFLKALGGTSIGTVNFEASEGFTKLSDKKNPFNYTYELEKADGSIVTMNISDPNTGNSSLSTTVQKTSGNAKKGVNYNRRKNDNANLAGGRYGISDAGLTREQRLANQFLNTNAGKDSNLEFNFSEAVSAFGFYGTDFERGALMGVEFTRVDGTTDYINLDLTNAEPIKEAGGTIRGTAFYSGYIADSEADYFTKVRFDIRDAKAGTNDIVAFDRMTFAAAPPAAKVPEPSVGLLALGAVLSGAAFKRRKQS